MLARRRSSCAQAAIKGKPNNAFCLHSALLCRCLRQREERKRVGPGMPCVGQAVWLKSPAAAVCDLRRRPGEPGRPALDDHDLRCRGPSGCCKAESLETEASRVVGLVSRAGWHSCRAGGGSSRRPRATISDFDGQFNEAAESRGFGSEQALSLGGFESARWENRTKKHGERGAWRQGALPPFTFRLRFAKQLYLSLCQRCERGNAWRGEMP